mmetsp:Transcript_25986/g.60070  ORF Transcript_25986/g.60070 Transcript_25986/m.60070 type:complete len:340 (+) Transcript_25986:147-1166(+)
MELNVPTNLAGMAIVEPLALDVKHDGRLVYITELARCYFLLLLQYAIQCYFIYYLAVINHRKEFSVKCSDNWHDVGLELVCVFIYCLAVWAEIDDAIGTVMLLWSHPSVQLAERMEADEQAGKKGYTKYMPVSTGLTSSISNRTVASGAVLEADKSEETTTQSLTSFVFHTVTRTKKPGMKQWDLTQMGRCYKMWTILTIGIPKVIIILFVGYFGGLYICYSPSPEAMIQNSLAMTFVVEVEHILYKAFTPPASADHLENAKGFTVPLNNNLRLLLWFITAAIYPVVTLCSTLFIVLHANAAPFSLRALVRLVSWCDDYSWKEHWHWNELTRIEHLRLR